MNVREWVTGRSSQVPESLSARIMEMIGADANEPDSRAGEVCLSAATRSLRDLMASGRTGRETALDLLAVDALATFAYEHASESPNGAARLKSLATDGAKSLGGILNGNG